MAPALYLDSIGSKVAAVAFLPGFAVICTALVWFRRKTAKWTIPADADAWLAHRSWRRLHPRRAKYLRFLQRSLLFLPSLYSALVLFFLPVASHTFYFGTRLVPHYRLSTPLNWLIIKSPRDVGNRVFFSNQGAARVGFTPIWFNRSMPSTAIFFTSGPRSPEGFRLPEGYLASGDITLLGVRQFRLGMITATCLEYRHTYKNTARFPTNIFNPPELWGSLCSTRPNGVDYNLSAAFFGHREDMPAFYDLLNSATPAN